MVYQTNIKLMIKTTNYTLTYQKENTKELSEAVTKLGEPLSQMGVILDEEAK